MSILINNSELQSVEQLPDNIQTVLALIPQGEQWVTTMIADKTNQVTFPSPEAFVEELNIGLRGTSLVYFNNLSAIVDIKKMFEISSNELRDMLNFVAPISTTSAKDTAKKEDPKALQMANLLAKYSLVNNDVFAKNNQFLEQKSRSELSYKWSATFSDHLTFYNILVYCEAKFNLGDPVEEQALNWAYEKAQTLEELAHYYCTYLAWAKQTDGRGVTIEDVFSQLTPLVLDNLDCPMVTFELDQTTLRDAITQWNKTGKTLGFTSFSTGLLNLALNIDLNQKGTIVKQATQYIHQLQSQLNDHLAVDTFISQAGQYRHYLFSLTGKNITLNIDDAGCLSFYSDRSVA